MSLIIITNHDAHLLILCSPESLLVMLEPSSVMSVGEEVSAPGLGDIICNQERQFMSANIMPI